MPYHHPDLGEDGHLKNEEGSLNNHLWKIIPDDSEKQTGFGLRHLDLFVRMTGP